MKILYEDNHVIVCFKPAGILSQKDSSNDLDILSMIKDYLIEKYNKPGDAYLGLVHRLDRNVSGVMVFAKTSKAAQRLNEDKFIKKYRALCMNEVTPKEGVFRDLISKNEKLKKAYFDKNGKEALLEYKVIGTKMFNNHLYSVVDINLLTGRFHQIRYQFSSRGFSLFGDAKYGNPDQTDGYVIGLTSYELSFHHPITKELLTFTYLDDTYLWK